MLLSFVTVVAAGAAATDTAAAAAATSWVFFIHSFLCVRGVFFFSILLTWCTRRPQTDQPQVTLQLGSTLNPDDIKEGDDVYFECQIKANPKEHRITWWHDVSTSLAILLFSTHLYAHSSPSTFRANLYTYLLCMCGCGWVWWCGMWVRVPKFICICIILSWVQLSAEATHQSICRATA